MQADAEHECRTTFPDEILAGDDSELEVLTQCKLLSQAAGNIF